jgi:hypothetical protein
MLHTRYATSKSAAMDVDHMIHGDTNFSCVLLVRTPRTRRQTRPGCIGMTVTLAN